MGEATMEKAHSQGSTHGKGPQLPWACYPNENNLSIGQVAKAKVETPMGHVAKDITCPRACSQGHDSLYGEVAMEKGT